MSRLLHICIETRDPNGTHWLLAWSLPPIVDYHSHEHLEKRARKAPQNVSNKTADLMWGAELKRGSGYVLTPDSFSRANNEEQPCMLNAKMRGIESAMKTMSGWLRVRMIFWFEDAYGGRFRSQK